MSAQWQSGDECDMGSKSQHRNASKSEFLPSGVRAAGYASKPSNRADQLVDKDELFAGQPDIGESLDTQYGSTFRIGAYTIGYTRDINLFRFVETGIGANFSAYSLPAAIKPYYGDHPIGGNIFVRFRLRPSEK